MEAWIVKVLVYLVRELRKIKGELVHQPSPGEPPAPPDIAETLNAQELATIQQTAADVEAQQAANQSGGN